MTHNISSSNPCISVSSNQMLVPFSAKNSFGQAAKQLSERHFSFKSEGRALDVRVSQEWKDDDKGGTDIGFGACVYPGAYVLAEFLCANPHIVREKSVLELGSGTGLVSVVCASLGAARVTATGNQMREHYVFLYFRILLLLFFLLKIN